MQMNGERNILSYTQEQSRANIFRTTWLMAKVSPQKIFAPCAVLSPRLILKFLNLVAREITEMLSVHLKFIRRTSLSGISEVSEYFN